jgi:hypothetical protein
MAAYAFTLSNLFGQTNSQTVLCQRTYYTDDLIGKIAKDTLGICGMYVRWSYCTLVTCAGVDVQWSVSFVTSGFPLSACLSALGTVHTVHVMLHFLKFP